MIKIDYPYKQQLFIFLLCISIGFFTLTVQSTTTGEAPKQSFTSLVLDSDFDKIAQELDEMPALSLPEKLQLLAHFLGIKCLDAGSYLYEKGAMVFYHVNEHKTVYGSLAAGLLALAYYLHSLEEKEKQQKKEKTEVQEAQKTEPQPEPA